MLQRTWVKPTSSLLLAMAILGSACLAPPASQHEAPAVPGGAVQVDATTEQPTSSDDREPILGDANVAPSPDENQDSIKVPRPPRSFQAEYAVGFGDTSLARLEITGHAIGTVRLGSGTVDDSATTLSIRLWSPKHPEIPQWTGDMALLNAARLSSIDLRCHPSSEDHGVLCPGTGETYNLEIGDAADAPAYLGLGPFLGLELRAGEAYRYSVWDPTGAFNVTWRAHSYQGLDGQSCLELRSPVIATPKTPFFLAPWAGQLVVCDGLPLPQEIRLGKLSLRLQSLHGDGAIAFEGAPWTLPRPSAARGGCEFSWPEESPEVLPSNRYIEWAKNNDATISQWIHDHPEYQLLPSVGLKLPDNAPALNTGNYNIVGIALLYDRASGTVLPRAMEAKWTEFLVLPPQQEYQESEHVAPRVEGLSAASMGCVASPQAIHHVVQPLLDWIDGHGDPVFYQFAPETGENWQGAAPWTFPLQHIVRVHEAMENKRDWAFHLQPVDPWPLRASLRYFPAAEESSVSFLVGGAADLSGWVRFLERDGWVI